MDIDLKTLKRSELQKLAKENGIKANKKNDTIIQELRKLWEGKIRNVSDIENNNSPDLFVSEDEKENCNVTTRGRKAKLPKPTFSAVEDGDSSIEAPPELMALITPSKQTDTAHSEEVIEYIQDEDDHEISFKITTPIAKPLKRTRSAPRNKELKTAVKKKSSDKTFSISKNRTSTKIPSGKVPVKRKSNDQNSAQTKRTRSSFNEAKERDEVFKMLEKKTGLPASLRTSQIPRFKVNGVSTNKFSSATKIEKAHQKMFGKMESIEDYQKRKADRANKLLGSQKKREVLNRLSQPKNKTPKVEKPKKSFLSPTPVKKGSGRVFKPSITSTSKIQTNFTKIKTLNSKKSLVSFAKTPDQVKNKNPAGSKTPLRKVRTSLTPFKPSNTNTPTSEKKKAFDLKASLKKPLTWQTHKGPLQKFNDTNTKPSFQERMKNAKKAPKVSTREKRRNENNARRKNTKADQMAKRRGV